MTDIERERENVSKRERESLPGFDLRWFSGHTRIVYYYGVARKKEDGG